MSSDTAVATGLTTCLFCSLGCRAGLRLGGPDQYVPDYGEGAGEDYAGLCARGSMLAELTNHRDRLLWPLVAGKETSMADAVRRAAEALRVAAVNGRPMAFIDGNADLASLAQAAAALGKLLPKDRMAFYVPPADAELVAGCETSGAGTTAPKALRDADAILIIGNPFATHPVVAHWVLDRAKAAARGPLMVLDVRSGVTSAYATEAAVIPPGQEHVALAAMGKALGVRGCDADTSDIDAVTLGGWARTLSEASRPVVVVAAECGRAARWFEVGLLAGEIARASGGTLLPLTVYGGALGAARLSARLGLADFGTLCTLASESPGEVALCLGEGLADRLGGGRRCVAAMSLAPTGGEPCDTALPLAWAFETGGPVLLPGMGLVTSEAAIRPPAGVPTLSELAVALAGEPGTAVTDFADLPPARREGGDGPDLSPMTAAGDGQGPVVVLAGDGVNFADGSVTRRVSFAAKVLGEPTLALSRAEALALGVGDGRQVRVAASGAELVARVEVQQEQAQGQAVLSGAYPESQRLVSAACGGAGPAPVRVTIT